MHSQFIPFSRLANKESGNRMGATGLIGGDFTPSTAPAFVATRGAVFDRLWKEYEDSVWDYSSIISYFIIKMTLFLTQIAARPDITIQVTLPSGDVKAAVAFKTTPYDIAKAISQGLADSVVVAKVLYKSKLEDDSIIACDEDEGKDTDDSCLCSIQSLFHANNPFLSLLH